MPTESLCSTFIVVGHNSQTQPTVTTSNLTNTESLTTDNRDTSTNPIASHSSSSLKIETILETPATPTNDRPDQLNFQEPTHKNSTSDAHSHSTSEDSNHNQDAKIRHQIESQTIISPKNEEPLPITNLCIINATQDEKIPYGWKCCSYTISQQLANLNSGANLSDCLYLCYKREPDKLPIYNIGIWYNTKEILPDYWSNAKDVTILKETYKKRLSANIGNESYIMFKRVSETTSVNTPVITDLKIIIPKYNERAPHYFHTIEKPLMTGLLSTKVLISYKRAFRNIDYISYTPKLLFKYFTSKSSKNQYSSEMLETVSNFCLPRGCSIEAWPPTVGQPLPTFSTFVLTDIERNHTYGAVLSFYEEVKNYKQELSKDELSKLNLYTGVAENYININHKVYKNKAICLLSKYSFFDAFQEFLCYIYRLSQSSRSSNQACIEELIADFCNIIPPNKVYRPRIVYNLDEFTTIDLEVSGSIFQKHNTSKNSKAVLSRQESISEQIHHQNITYSRTWTSILLADLSVENIYSLFVFMLLQTKILVHSLERDRVTRACEALLSLVFPFKYDGGYVPCCPKGMLEPVLSSPVATLAGASTEDLEKYTNFNDDLSEDLCDIVFVNLDSGKLHYKSSKFNQNIEKLVDSSIFNFLKLETFPRLQKLKDDLYRETPSLLNPYGQMIAKRSSAIDISNSKGANMLLNQSFTGKEDPELSLKRNFIERNIAEAFLSITCRFMSNYRECLHWV